MGGRRGWQHNRRQPRKDGDCPGQVQIGLGNKRRPLVGRGHGGEISQLAAIRFLVQNP